MKDLAHFIDHTNLSPDAKSIDIEDLCSEAIKYDFASVCLNPVYVHLNMLPLPHPFSNF